MTTRFLASVRTVDEASTLLAAGADIIDIKDPLHGALGAVDTAVAEAIVDHVAGRVMTSATVGDLPLEVSSLNRAISNTAASGVDIIKVGVFAATIPADILHLLESFAADGHRIVLVYFADRQPDLRDFSPVAGAGVHGVMLDTSDKTGGSLRTILDDTVLNYFIRRARSENLLTGLAGSLHAADIPALLALGPDYLGFRGALCNQQFRNNAVDMQSACNIRAMIPRPPAVNAAAMQYTATV